MFSIFISEYYKVRDGRYYISVWVDPKHEFEFDIFMHDHSIRCTTVCIDEGAYEEIIKYIENDLKIHAQWICKDLSEADRFEISEGELKRVARINEKIKWSCSQDLTECGEDVEYVEW